MLHLKFLTSSSYKIVLGYIIGKKNRKAQETFACGNIILKFDSIDCFTNLISNEIDVKYKSAINTMHHQHELFCKVKSVSYSPCVSHARQHQWSDVNTLTNTRHSLLFQCQLYKQWNIQRFDRGLLFWNIVK